jgi:pyruvate dehydrogenase E1 component alpha subunit
MAALWKLPAIFVCENNRYGMGTAMERASAIYDIAERACSYDMAAETVDGMDAIAVYDATERAVERARVDQLPTLLEMRTYRFMGHSMSDPIHGHYRTREEVEEQKEKDPIFGLLKRLEAEKLATQADFDALDEEVKKEVDDAVAFAESSPDPDPEQLYTDVYAD